jgi:hypothetical protein
MSRAITNAVFDTAFDAHTSPIVPFTVTVIVCPGWKFSPAPDHTYRVPLATDAATGAPSPGCSVVTPVTTGDSVSATTRLSIVAAPVFVITIWYWIAAPTPFPPVCVFTTENVIGGAGTTKPVTPDIIFVVVHAVDALRNAVFDTAVSKQI